MSDAHSSTGGIEPGRLKAAFTVFKKRWKITRLDDESRLGGGRPMTSGRKSEIAGITPPNDFPAEVWQELARQGRIKHTGGGFYTMP
ncbi:MAG: hypothetical protein ACKVU4_12710 [Phycisphaerales bacterium]